jgi:hypothetical protein
VFLSLRSRTLKTVETKLRWLNLNQLNRNRPSSFRLKPHQKKLPSREKVRLKYEILNQNKKCDVF